MKRLRYMKRIYNKLVRDNIPDIIRKNNETPNIKILSQDEYIFHLKKKLQEEVDEFVESDDITELADILEVVDALSNAYNHSLNDVMQIKDKKAISNGKFNNKILLIDVVEHQ